MTMIPTRMAGGKRTAGLPDWLAPASQESKFLMVAFRFGLVRNSSYPVRGQGASPNPLETDGVATLADRPARTPLLICPTELRKTSAACSIEHL
jgi:hypothetical protein